MQNSQFCLINAVLEHFITQTRKKLKTTLKDFMGTESNKYASESTGLCMKSKQILSLKNLLV